MIPKSDLSDSSIIYMIESEIGKNLLFVKVHCCLFLCGYPWQRKHKLDMTVDLIKLKARLM